MSDDIVVIGAGAAGIAAARALAGRGRSVVVLEASDRVGGRAWTVDLAGMPLDLGCGWLHSANRNPLVALGQQAGFTIDSTRSVWQQQWRDIGFSPAERFAADAAWEALEQRFHNDPPSSDRASDALPQDGRWNAYCQALSGFMNGASLQRLSITDFLAYDDAASDTNWRVREGYGSLIAASLAGIDVRMSSPVRRIGFSSGGVQVETTRGIIDARAAIVTVSTNVLAAEVITLEADVSGHIEAASQLPLGLADKLFIELIGDHGFEPDTHLLGDPHNADTGSYYIRPFGNPVIECFFGGTGAVVLEQHGLLGAFEFAAGELVSLLGSNIRRHFRPLVASTWCRADWIRGSYSHALPGHADARSALAAPVADRLFFAGEATHAHDFSTAHGAWASGIRAADEVLRCVR